MIPKAQLMDLNAGHPLAENVYERYSRNINFETDSAILSQLGVESTNSLHHPYIFNLLNVDHREHIHSMFVYMAENTPNIIV